MADAIKNMYNHESLGKLALDIGSVYSEFQVDGFLKSTMNDAWKDLELKDRMRSGYIQKSIRLQM